MGSIDLLILLNLSIYFIIFTLIIFVFYKRIKKRYYKFKMKSKLTIIKGDKVE